jgi:hypothetical protein
LENYDFEKDPLKATIEAISTKALDGCQVRDTFLLSQVKKHRNYYKLYYYVKEKRIGANSMILLGFYDYYYDLLLVTFGGQIDVVYRRIASLSGDGGSFVTVTSNWIDESRLGVVEIKGTRGYGVPDTIRIFEKKKSTLVFRNGRIEERLTYRMQGDSTYIVRQP